MQVLQQDILFLDFVNYVINFRKHLEKIAPVLIYPVVGILVMGLLMTFIVEPIMGGINTGLNNALTGMGSSSKVILRHGAWRNDGN